MELQLMSNIIKMKIINKSYHLIFCNFLKIITKFVIGICIYDLYYFIIKSWAIFKLLEVNYI